MIEGKSRRLLFVGSTGRVGRLLRKVWKMSPPRGADVVFQHRKLSEPPNAQNLEWSPLNGADPLLEETRRGGPFEAMLMFAGSTETPADHAAIARSCLDAAAAVGISRVLIASSSAVYNPDGVGARTEADDLAPQNDNGRAKAEMEKACFAHSFPPAGKCLLRIGNVAGADSLAQNVEKGVSPLEIHQTPAGNGPRRSYIGPITLARVLESLALEVRELPEVLNIAAPRPIGMDELASAAGLVWKYGARTGKARDLILDCGRLASVFDFSPENSTPRGIAAEWHAAGAAP